MNRRHARTPRLNASNSANGTHRLPLARIASRNLDEPGIGPNPDAVQTSAVDSAQVGTSGPVQAGALDSAQVGALDPVQAGAVDSVQAGAVTAAPQVQTSPAQSHAEDFVSEESLSEKTVQKKPTCIICQRTELVGAGYAELIKDVVEVVGYTADGKEAIDLCRGLQPALLITDMELANIDGLELCRTIRYEFPSVKLLVLSDPYNASRYYPHFLNAGVTTFCLFSSEPQSLLDAVDRALKGLHYFDEKLKLWINVNADRSEESTRSSISKEFAVAELIARIALSGSQISALHSDEA